VLQGVGGGMILPIGQMMMADAAGPKRMGRVMSIVACPRCWRRSSARRSAA